MLCSVKDVTNFALSTESNDFLCKLTTHLMAFYVCGFRRYNILACKDCQGFFCFPCDFLVNHSFPV